MYHWKRTQYPNNNKIRQVQFDFDASKIYLVIFVPPLLIIIILVSAKLMLRLAVRRTGEQIESLIQVGVMSLLFTTTENIAPNNDKDTTTKGATQQINEIDLSKTKTT